MAPLLHRQPLKTIYSLAFFVVVAFIRLPCWLIYYSWPPNRPRKTWTLQRTIWAQIIRELGQLPFKAGLLGDRDLSLEVPQKDLERFNARFVWIPELEKEDIVGVVGEQAARAGVESIAIPAYWFLKDNIKWSTEYEKAREDEKVLLYLHGGAFVVRFPFLASRLHIDICHRWGLHTRLTQQRLLPREYSIILCLFPECYRSTTDSVPGLLWNRRTHSQPQSSTLSRRTSILSARSDSTLKTSS